MKVDNEFELKMDAPVQTKRIGFSKVDAERRLMRQQQEQRANIGLGLFQ